MNEPTPQPTDRPLSPATDGFDGAFSDVSIDPFDDATDDDSWASPRARAGRGLRALTAGLAVLALCIACFTAGVRIGRDRAGSDAGGGLGRGGLGRGGFGRGAFRDAGGASGSITGNAALDALLGGATPTTGPVAAATPSTTIAPGPSTAPTTTAALGGLLPG